MAPDFRQRPSDDRIAGLKRPFVLVEDRSVGGGSALLYADPISVVRCDQASEVEPAFARIEAALAAGLHAAGFLAYELGYVFEPKLRPLTPPLRDLPLLWFGLFAQVQPVDASTLDGAFARLGPPPPIGSPSAGFDRARHKAKIATVLQRLLAGDAYQINLTETLRFGYDGDPLALYGALRVSQPVAHGAVVALDEATILSVSPELFLDVANGRATTRPMKGTAPRGADGESDRAAVAALRLDPKQLAENRMIVDLMRNDLSRVSVVGSVKAPDLFRVETYPTFHALTSTVVAELQPGVRLGELMSAMFPCGSITGAPKHSAMQIIRQLEDGPRGVYTGSIGTFSPDGSINLNVAIRTVTLLANGVGLYGVGGGIVADSKADDEYEECLVKARVLTDLAHDFGLIETMRWTPASGYVRLDLHLRRLGFSAQRLGFAFDRDAIEAMLDALAATWPNSEGDRRVRLELARDGGCALAHEILVPDSNLPMSVDIARERVDRGDPFLRHKTTRRRRFDAAYARAAASGRNEAIFLNRAGLVAEACRNNVFVERDGALVTPALNNGVLPGVLRQALLDAGQAIEGEVGLDELRRAERWFLGNSLRGLRRATLRPV
jgi:para-aminobenzoate synthetase / 4-amino-4-deoxychorismate lyase